MRRLWAILLFAAFAFAANVTVDAPVSAVTVYSNNFAFVTRAGSFTMPDSAAILHIINFSSEAVPYSITPRLTGARAAEHYSYSMEWNESKNVTEYLSLERLLNQSVGSTVSFRAGNESVEGRLAWYGDGMVGIGVQGGGIAIYKVSDISRITLPAATVSETVQQNTTEYERGLAIAAKGARGPASMTMTYLAAGPTWEASYKYYLGSEPEAGTGTMQGWARVKNNAGEDWENTSLKLVVGSPHIQPYYVPFTYPYAVPSAKYADSAGMGAAESAFNEFTPAQVSAYYVYSLASPASIKSGEEKSLPLLENNVSFKREYFWDTANTYPEKVFIVNNTGGESWAAGVFSVYLNNEFIGEESIEYTAKGHEARVSVSDLPDIKVKKETLNTTASGTDVRKTTTYKMRLSIENAMGEDVKLRINDHMNYGDEVRLVSSSLPVTQKADNVLEWNASVPHGGSLEIFYEYSVTTYYPDRYY